jgi:DNA-binding transcriptional regulator PaaX
VPATTLILRPKLAELRASGLIEGCRRDRAELWRLTPKGRARLAAIAGEIGPLPEAPQHRQWRQARAAAHDHIDRLREELHQELAAANDALGAEPSSAVLYELGDRLGRACTHLASATYCLNEWAEPHDASVDVDEPPYGRRSRREFFRWSHERPA